MPTKGWLSSNAPVLSILVGIVSFLLVQGTLLVVWGVKLEDRVNQIEGRGSPQLSAISERLTRVEVQMSTTAKELEKNSSKLDTLNDMFRAHK